MTIHLESNKLLRFAEELSRWKPVPHALVCLAKHELNCKKGIEFYVDTWPSCNVAVAITTASCHDWILATTVYLDAKDNRRLFSLLKQVPIDWMKEFYFNAIYPLSM